MIFVVIFLVFLSAMISAAEIAYFSLNSANAIKMKKKSKTGKMVFALLENPDKLSATIIFSKYTLYIAIIILAVILSNLLFVISDAPMLKFTVQVIAITFIIFLFTEFIPKLFAARYAISIANTMAFPLFLLEKLYRPINGILISLTNFVNQKAPNHRKNVSMEDISQALQLTDNEELSEDKIILEGIANFGNKSVYEIMKPRVDVVCIDIKSGFTKVLEIIIDSGFSRIPVFAGSLDNIKGILYIKDILPHNHKSAAFNWQTLIRPPFYVPETKKINNLLEEFQKNKVHLAVVINEYGGTSGIVTLEDVLEEIVGEIVDESDEEDHFFTKISDNIFLFDGKTMLADFFKITHCDETLFEPLTGDAETLAGLILELKGVIPPKGEKIDYQMVTFIIESADDRRIKTVKVEINQESNIQS